MKGKYSKIEVMKKVLKNFIECNEVVFNIEVVERYEKLVRESGVKLKNVCSYTTREKRENETDGVEHWFIDMPTANKLINEETILAYTKIGPYQYFATRETAMKNKENIYLIDPKGVHWMKKNNPDMDIVEINIRVSEEVRAERCKERSDFATSFVDRCKAEDDQFTAYEYYDNSDLIVYNDNFENALAEIISFIIKNNKVNMYLVIGRTGVGKDSLMEAAKDMINEVYL